MALLHVNFFSNTLGVCTNMEVILPQKGYYTQKEENTYPVLYLLHGMSDDCTIWSRRTSIERYATNYGIAVVMASAQLSYYTDMKYGSKFYTFFAKELPAVCHDFFPRISEKREDTFIAGLSMGGYGAFKLALRNPEQYAFAGSLSGALDIKNNIIHPEVWKLDFGSAEEIEGSENDLFFLSRELKKSGKELPQLYFSCGKDDTLAFCQNERFNEHLNKIGFEHEYEIYEGAHSWEYWDEHIKDILKRLPIKK